MGDPAGIGPEIIAKALAHSHVYDLSRPVVVGEVACMRAAVRITGVALDVRPASGISQGGLDAGAIDVIDLHNIDVDRVERGRLSPDAGRASYEYLERAAQLARAGNVAAVVTAPLNKEALSAAGWVGIGHTELLARFCGVPEDSVAMLLASEKLRVVHVSTHVSLRRAIELVRAARIVRVGRLAAQAAAQIVGRSPRIAVAGLNPHGGEHGLFGTEEEDEIEPAIDLLREEGWDVWGPMSPDTVFLRASRGEFDIVVAMYHDQGHIPSKFAGFHDTVNVTLGLPIIRTSVDHGTGYDIAGTGKASEENLVAAIALAATLASRATG